MGLRLSIKGLNPKSLYQYRTSSGSVQDSSYLLVVKKRTPENRSNNLRKTGLKTLAVVGLAM